MLNSKVLNKNYYKARKLAFFILLFFTSLFLKKAGAQAIDTTGLNYYYNLGVPTINKVWVGDDYTNASKALQKIAASDLSKLPRKNSGEAMAIFNKIVDIENFQLFDSTYYTLQMQMQSSNQALQAVKNLMLLYYSNNGSSQKIKYSNEITSCSISILFLLEKQMDITLSFFSDTTKLNERQKNGLMQAKKGLNTVISGVLVTIEKDYPYYQRNDIESLAAYFFPFFKRIQRIISDSDVIEFNRRIKSIRLNHEYKEIRDLTTK